MNFTEEKDSNDVTIILLAKVFDVFNIGIFPLISLFGFITNLINLIVFNDPEFSDKIYIYLRVHSIADILYLIGITLSYLAYIQYYLPFSFVHSITIQLFGLYLDLYFTSCLAIFNILIQIIVSFQRYLIFANIKYLKFLKELSPYLIILIIFVVSLLMYAHEIIFFEVLINEKNGTINGTQIFFYEYRKNKIGNKYIEIYDNLAISVQLFRGPICLILFIIVNMLTRRSYQKFLVKKTTIRRGEIILKTNSSSIN
jgi:hypothetical protein